MSQCCRRDEESTLSTRRAGAAAPVTVRAPAKVNLHLDVGPPRPDGYHGLVTVFHAVSLFDEVTASPADELSLSIRGEGEDTLTADRENLAWRAAMLLAGRAGVEPAVRLDLVKGIPVAGGLAGGSADAAATLVACDALWGTSMDRGELLELAAELGSDVAFALTGGTALGTGRGERLTPVLAQGPWHWVLAVAHGGLSTPEVYRELDRLRAERQEHRDSDRKAGGRDGDRDQVVVMPPSADDEAARTPDALLEALRAGVPGRLGALLHNDLQAAALSLRPALRRTLRAGVDLDARGGLVSGSGPTCVFLADSADGAVRLAAALAGAGVARTVRVAHGPVHGARVLEQRNR